MIQRKGTRARDREPQEQSKTGRLVEAEQGLQGIHVLPERRADGNDHDHAEPTGRDAREQSRDQQDATNKFQTRHERCQDVRQRDASLDEIPGHGRQMLEFSPAAPQNTQPVTKRAKSGASHCKCAATDSGHWTNHLIRNVISSPPC
jgi:hypothetical protein